MPDWSAQRILGEVARPRGSRSLSSHLQSRLGLKGVRMGLLRECLDKDAFNDPVKLAEGIKALPLRLLAPRPLDEAISTAGGVTFGSLDDNLMLQAMPGVFCAGEMLDWEAPTGGYLLTACFSTGAPPAACCAGWGGAERRRRLLARGSGSRLARFGTCLDKGIETRVETPMSLCLFRFLNLNTRLAQDDEAVNGR